jgi:3-mercaptopyruvate sulfurtransferase SseA
MFVLTLMGYDHVRNYDASMREWANREDTPLQMPA